MHCRAPLAASGARPPVQVGAGTQARPCSTSLLSLCLFSQSPFIHGVPFVTCMERLASQVPAPARGPQTHTHTHSFKSPAHTHTTSRRNMHTHTHARARSSKLSTPQRANALVVLSGLLHASGAAKQPVPDASLTQVCLLGLCGTPRSLRCVCWACVGRLAHSGVFVGPVWDASLTQMCLLGLCGTPRSLRCVCWACVGRLAHSGAFVGPVWEQRL